MCICSWNIFKIAESVTHLQQKDDSLKHGKYFYVTIYIYIYIYIVIPRIKDTLQFWLAGS